jgi:hypothetical protein
VRSTQRESLFAGFVPDTVDLPRTMAPASLEAWARIEPKLHVDECRVLLALYDAIQATGCADFTGRELSEQSGMSPFTVRPRLHGLHKKHAVIRSPETRESRADGEMPSHAYRPHPELPRSAVQRWREALKAK